MPAVPVQQFQRESTHLGSRSSRNLAPISIRDREPIPSQQNKFVCILGHGRVGRCWFLIRDSESLGAGYYFGPTWQRQSTV